MNTLTIWYNPIMNEIGVLSVGGTFLMEKVNFMLGKNAARRLGGAKWVKIGSFET